LFEQRFVGDIRRLGALIRGVGRQHAVPRGSELLLRGDDRVAGLRGGDRPLQGRRAERRDALLNDRLLLRERCPQRRIVELRQHLAGPDALTLVHVYRDHVAGLRRAQVES